MPDFHRGGLGFELQQRIGEEAAFVSAGVRHHHVAFNAWGTRGAPPAPEGTTGLFHLAILYPDRAALADAPRRLEAAGRPLTGASDHGVSEALCLDDPEGNGVELYRDRPREDWPRDAEGGLAMITRRLGLGALRTERG